ncbi:MAG: phosphatidylserine decarboxylase [Bacteriovoracia bacterium]
MSLRYWNRRRGRMENEDVYGGAGVAMLYGNPVGYALTEYLLSRSFVSKLYGAFQNTAFSAGKVEPFFARFGLRREDWVEKKYASFNDFFIRQFRPGLRPFPAQADLLGAPAEARYLAYQNSSAPLSLPVKGLNLDPLAILSNTPRLERFRGGPVLLARLCPVDYHRFHFPDSGIISHFHEEHGKLHSVNPAALRRDPGLFLRNERHISILETENFGSLAYVEVGALCVGRIVQSHTAKEFARGAEKGYFLFGGSTVILYGEQGRWEPTEDLLRHTAEGFETLVELGSPVAKLIRKQ